MTRREITSLIYYGITSAVASLAAVGTFWWLAKYSTICERDIIGTAIIVWCTVLIRMLMWMSKEEANDRGK